MKKIYGMPLRDWKKLGKILNPTITTDFTSLTVAEYIDKHPEAITKRRVSAKGTELIEVTYPTGKVKEYPVRDINCIAAREY